MNLGKTDSYVRLSTTLVVVNVRNETFVHCNVRGFQKVVRTFEACGVLKTNGLANVRMYESNKAPSLRVLLLRSFRTFGKRP